ncbi:MAG: hypothetical protein ACRDX9_14015, partial [Acidimicrobiia bacterium]
VRSGDWTGTIVANPDFVAQDPGDIGFTDSAGRVWTVAGDAEITDWQPRFVGQIDKLAPHWPEGDISAVASSGLARVDIDASGPLQRLDQGAKPLESTLRRLVASPSVAGNVAGYWPMEDGRDADRFSSPIPGIPAMTIKSAENITLATDSDLPASEPLPTINGGMLASYGVNIPSGPSDDFAVECFVHIPTAAVSPAFTRVIGFFTNGTVRDWRLRVNDTNVNLEGRNLDGSLVINNTFGIDATFYGQFTLVRVDVVQDAGNIDWEITYVPLNDTGVAFGNSGTLAGTVGRVTRVGNYVTPPADGFSVGHYIVSTGLVLGWLAGADTAWVGETAAHRVWRLCREEQIPVAIVGDNTLTEFFRGNPELSEKMGPQRPKPLVELLQECADTDLGVLYEQRGQDGIAFRTHKSLHNQTSALTLDLEQRGLADPFEPVLDDQRLRNDITVARRDGSEARAVDETSVEVEGLYNEEITVNVEDDLHLPDQAGWRLHLGTWPELRLPAIASSMLAAGAPVIADWLDTDLGDRFTAANLMRQYDRDTRLLVEGYDETLSFFGWDATLNGSPAGPWEVGVRDDDTRGKRDTAGSQLNNTIDGDDTSLTVAVTSGPGWTTATGDFPFDLEIG